MSVYAGPTFTPGAVFHVSPAESQQDNVNSPNHYTAGGIEVIDILRAKMTPEQFKGYCRGNVLKYVLRYDKKNGAEDLEKARVYLGWLIEAEKK